LKKEVDAKRNQNQKLEHENNLLERKVQVMEDNIERVVNENVE
jgi:hypothetical protein